MDHFVFTLTVFIKSWTVPHKCFLIIPINYFLVIYDMTLGNTNKNIPFFSTINGWPGSQFTSIVGWFVSATGQKVNCTLSFGELVITSWKHGKTIKKLDSRKILGVHTLNNDHIIYRENYAVTGVLRYYGYFQFSRQTSPFIIINHFLFLVHDQQTITTTSNDLGCLKENGVCA